jgi:hypothetical protein
MKSYVMKPFRASRSGTEDKGKGEAKPTRDIRKVSKQARRSPRRTEKPEPKTHVVPYRKGIKLMSERDHERARKVGKTDAGVKCLTVEANTGRKEKEKEGFERKGGYSWFFYEVENAPSTDYEMITRLAHDFPPIH